MNIIDQLIGLLAPYECLGCGAEGRLLCLFCASLLEDVEPRCYRCLKPSLEYRTCSGCQLTSYLSAVYPATNYHSVAKALVWKCKFGNSPSAATEMARLMSGLLAGQTGLLVPTPTATSRVRQRGYDQATLLARAVTRQTPLAYQKCLTRIGQGHQVGANRSQRFEQIKDSFRVHKTAQIIGRRIILVDDVLTTGATLESAAQALLKAGALQVNAIVFAQA